jgi:hypothetical protein
MITIITTSTKIFSMTDLASVLRIDLIVFLILIGLLIFREFLKLYFDQYALSRPYTKLKMGRLIDIAIVTFFYVFSYVLIFRVLNTIYSTSAL